MASLTKAIWVASKKIDGVVKRHQRRRSVPKRAFATRASSDANLVRPKHHVPNPPTLRRRGLRSALAERRVLGEQLPSEQRGRERGRARCAAAEGGGDGERKE